jgi:hypothetical protein
MKEWRQDNQEERERQRSIDSKERAQEREQLLAAMKELLASVTKTPRHS